MYTVLKNVYFILITLENTGGGGVEIKSGRELNQAWGVEILYRRDFLSLQ